MLFRCMENRTEYIKALVVVARIFAVILPNSYNKDETEFSSRSNCSVLYCGSIFRIPIYIIKHKVISCDFCLFVGSSKM